MSGPRRVLAAAGLLALASVVATGAQTRDATSVLADMRRALGGDAALDAVQTLSIRGSVTETYGGRSKSLSFELLAMLPDHFMIVRRDSQSGGPLPIDITYFRGFAGPALIRRTDSNIAFPPDPGPQTPQAIADREQRSLLHNRQEFARLGMVLFGKALSSYPLAFSYVGTGSVNGQSTEMIIGQSADGFATTLHVDAVTRLPAVIEWQGLPEIMATTSSTMVVRGNQVVSQSPQAPLPADPTVGVALVTRRLLLSDFKLRDGLNWPHRFREMVDVQIVADTRLGNFSINPKIDARKFDVGR